MEINYRLLNPTGNITALVETSVPKEYQPQVAEAIMTKEIRCEQVGFIMDSVEGSDITLRMAGGEFCGNATMCTAVLFCDRMNMVKGENRLVSVKVIGTTGLVKVNVSLEADGYHGSVEMPKPLKISEERFFFEDKEFIYPVVTFAGISHVIVENEIPVSMAEPAVKIWCDRLKVQSLGLMVLDEKKKYLRPLVYVKYPETLVWESSCASGTTAVGAYLSKKSGKSVKFEFGEPGGKLGVETFEDGRIILSGKVSFL